MIRRKNQASTGKIIFFIICAVMIISIAVGLKYWFDRDEVISENTSVEPAPNILPEQSDTKPLNRGQNRPVAVIDHEKQKNQAEFKDLMQKRKARYGIEKSLDMVVRPDESVKIGDTVVPVQEIIDKIRLKNNEVIEGDIKNGPDKNTGWADIEKLFSKMEDARKKFHKLETKLADRPDHLPQDLLSNDPESAYKFIDDSSEYARLSRINQNIDDYRENIEDIDQTFELLEKNETRIRKTLIDDIQNLATRKKETEENLDAAIARTIAESGPALPLNITGSITKEGNAKIIESSLKRFEQLEQELEAAKSADSDISVKKLVKEHEKLEGIVASYKKYKKNLEKIEAKKELLVHEDIHVKINALNDISDLKTEQVLLLESMRKALTEFLPDDPDDSNDPDGLISHDADETALFDIDGDLTDDASLLKRLESLETRYIKLDRQIKDPLFKKKKEKYLHMADEYQKLAPIMAEYRNYLKTQKKIRDKKRILDHDNGSIKEVLKNHANLLLVERNRLESDLSEKLIGDKPPDMYGIYIVRANDNVWNIHFAFLREYFQKRGVLMSKVEDEPLSSGTSSGVGKILKFSENMVYIYNVRERKLDVNLDFIHPLSKIVVFNISRAIRILDEIDYSNVNTIHFDGETLWIPAKS
ncbi:PCRF domain-containing protein [Desulfobacterales bacterium HSG16]|nr:PCRF domain-containing protein [Desulfobacterales bacterium HSG16]